MPQYPPFRPAFGQPPRVPLGWVIALCVAWTLLGLIGHDPWKPDEAHSFGLVYSILQGGDWVVPMLAGEPFMERPPLFYLTAAGFAHLFSGLLPLHDGARLATGFYMTLALIFTGLAGRELWGKGYGRITALIMIACLGLLVRTHQLISDVALLAGFSISLYGIALSPSRPVVAGILAGTGIGIAFMAKGLFAPFVMGLTILLLPLLTKKWRTRQYALCLTLALAAALPWLATWPILLYQRAPQLFSEWLWVYNLGGLTRFTLSNEPGFYLNILLWFAWPALPLALWTLWRHKWAGWLNAPILLPMTFFLATLALLSYTPQNRDVYALPLVPPLAILATAAVDSLRRGAASALDWFSVMTFSLFATVLWIGWFATLSGYPAEIAEKFNKLQPGIITHLNGLTLFIALVLSAAWILAVARMKRGALRGIVNSAMGITLVWGLLATIWLPWLDAGKSYRGMITSMQNALPDHYGCIAGKNLGEPQRAMLHYFSGIITERDEKRQMGCNLMLVQGRDRPLEHPGPEWSILWEGNRPGDETEWFTLFQRR